MHDSQLVRLEQVSRHFAAGSAGQVRALDEISVAFEQGTFTAVMGPSGSGKSTLLQCAAGLDRPDAGRVVLDGVDLGTLREKALTELRRERIGFVFQAFNLLGALSAEQNVGLPLRLAGRRPDQAEVRTALDRVGLGGRAGHLPSQMSGGQQQRVAIARALITRPKVLFADEPTGALDSSSSKTVLKLLRGLVDEQGQTTIMVTHDPVAASYADRVLFLVDGRVADEMHRPTTGRVAENMARLEAAPDTDPGDRKAGPDGAAEAGPNGAADAGTRPAPAAARFDGGH